MQAPPLALASRWCQKISRFAPGSARSIAAAVHHFINPGEDRRPGVSHTHALLGSIPSSGTISLRSPTLAEAPRRERGQCGCKSCRRDHFEGPDATADRHPTFNRTMVRLQLPPGSQFILPCRPTVGLRTLNPPMMVRIHLGQPIWKMNRTSAPGPPRKRIGPATAWGACPPSSASFLLSSNRRTPG